MRWPQTWYSQMGNLARAGQPLLVEMALPKPQLIVETQANFGGFPLI
jgi:hypothetical protein